MKTSPGPGIDDFRRQIGKVDADLFQVRSTTGQTIREQIEEMSANATTTTTSATTTTTAASTTTTAASSTTSTTVAATSTSRSSVPLPPTAEFP